MFNGHLKKDIDNLNNRLKESEKEVFNLKHELQDLKELFRAFDIHTKTSDLRLSEVENKVGKAIFIRETKQ